jgi:choline monooxygenase
MAMDFDVDPDITRAATLDSAFYRDLATWDLARERVFARTWQWIGDLADVAAPQSLSPRDLLPGLIDEPLLLARDEAGTLRCLSNVCTHRGNLLVREACRTPQIRCGYHSRRFDLAGRMVFMPEFGEARDFPSPSDNLPAVPFATWRGQAFAALDPAAPLDAFLAGLEGPLGALPIERCVRDAGRDRDFTVAAHWALYVENYLEGFHIPFVHAGLNDVVEYASYATDLTAHGVLQTAIAKPGESAFAPDAEGECVAAYYAWVFPNLMLNLYPWGLSLNCVVPETPRRTRVAFRSYVFDASKLDRGAGAGLERVEQEDEAIVEAVQRGVGSRLYRGGRYSASRERGVHHFHRLLCAFLRAPGAVAATRQSRPA